MNRTLSIGASGMQAQQLRTDNIANNMANVSTTAFKRGTVYFQDMLYDTMASPGANSAQTNLPTGMQFGTGVRTQSASKNFSQGTTKSTERDLDVAIEGTGFFQVTMPDGGYAYTRSGNFQMDSTGQVLTPEGYEIVGFPSLGENFSRVDIAADGTVSVVVNGTSVNKGRLQIARIPNPEGMNYLGHNLYQTTDASGNAVLGNPSTANFGKLSQRYLEESNVEIVNEMVDLIAAQRAYELNSKSIKAGEEMLRIVTGLQN